jgi:ribosomal protein S12 methylthiotransferase
MKKNHRARLVYIVSLGCPKNFVDTEVVAGILVTEGFKLTFDPNSADIYWINTCAFIPPAREEAEEVIEEALRWQRKSRRQRKVVVSGCLIQWDKDGIYQQKYPQVDLWFGIDEVAQAGKYFKSLYTSPMGKKLFSSNPPEYIYDEKTPRLPLTLPHFAYLKVAEGCDNRCAYCAIPGIRGNLRSREVKSIVTETKNLLSMGVKEIILIAQDTSAYGRDLNTSRHTPAKLLAELDVLPGDFWLRLLYTHPASVDDAFIRAIANSKHVVPYIDIPLQHISDKILTAMNRHTNKDNIRKLLDKLRNKIPEIAIRTTFLTGFPGETEKDFEELHRFVEEQQFDRLGVFQFFPEPGTSAATMPEQVDTEIADERADAIMETQRKISLKKNKRLVGKVFNVIIDSSNGTEAVGRSYMDAPEIDNTINVISSGTIPESEFVKVKITEATEFDLTGITVTETD